MLAKSAKIASSWRNLCRLNQLSCLAGKLHARFAKISMIPFSRPHRIALHPTEVSSIKFDLTSKFCSACYDFKKRSKNLHRSFRSLPSRLQLNFQDTIFFVFCTKSKKSMSWMWSLSRIFIVGFIIAIYLSTRIFLHVKEFLSIFENSVQALH